MHSLSCFYTYTLLLSTPIFTQREQVLRGDATDLDGAGVVLVNDACRFFSPEARQLDVTVTPRARDEFLDRPCFAVVL